MKLFEKGELKTLWPFYLNCLFSALLYFAPVFYMVYFISLNLSFFQIGIIMAMWPLSSVIFEIPTGAIADIYGRKFSHIFGLFLSAICYLTLFFIKDFYPLLLVFFFLGIAATFSSGASEAWVVDLIKKKNQSLLNNYFIKERQLYAIGGIISGFIGAFVVKQMGVSIIWPFTAVAFLFSAIILFFGKEKYIRKKSTIKNSFKELNIQTKNSLKYTFNHPVLFYFLIATLIVVFAGNFSGSMAWTPLLKSLNFPDYAFGYLWSAMALMGIIAPGLSKKFLKPTKEKQFLIFSTVGIILSAILIIFVFDKIIAILLLLSSLFFFNFESPVSRTYFHKFIQNKLRATISSFQSMLFYIAALIASPLVGYLVDLIGARYVIFLSGLLTIPAIIFYLKIKEK